MVDFSAMWAFQVMLVVKNLSASAVDVRDMVASLGREDCPE